MGAFGWFATARVISLLGSTMAPVALAFAVLEHGTPADLGLVLAARLVPYVALVLIGGSTADRFSRSVVLAVGHTGCGLTQGAVAVTLLLGHYDLGLLISLLAAMAVFGAFISPAARGAVPELVPADRLQKATSLIGTIRHGSRIVGPAVAGVLVATAGSGVALAIDAATYLVAAVLLARLKLTSRPVRTSMLADLSEGWQVFRSTTWVWVVVLSFGVTNAIHHGVWTVLGPAMAKVTIGEAAWGVVLSCSGAGVVVMSLSLYRVRQVPLWVGQLTTIAAAPPLLALGLGAGAPTLAVIAFVEGLGMGVFAIAWETALQRQIPNHMLSRVAAYDELGSFVAIPIGQITAPLIALQIGNATTAIWGSALYAVAALAPLLVPSVLSQHDPAGEPERQRA